MQYWLLPLLAASLGVVVVRADLSCGPDGSGDVCVDGKKLILLQSVWRHGDRAPTQTYPKDAFQEDAWDFGGGGFGQLSPIGMVQHVGLGKKIRKRYVEGTPYKFLKYKYDSHEIYIRSTDVNRTLISAQCNMIGMYGQQDYMGYYTEGTDYPSKDDLDQNGVQWPNAFIPIAIHTVDNSIDYIGNADSKDCPRQDWLWDFAKKNVKKIQDLQNDNQATLDQATAGTGMTVDIDSLWIVTDVTLIESIHMGNDSLLQQNSWVTPDLYNQLDQINGMAELYQSGGDLDGAKLTTGEDLGWEIQKLRAGAITNDIYYHWQLKDGCVTNPNADNCKWANRLRYFAYSAHDSTIYSWFTCLGIEHFAVPGHQLGYPHYSAAVMVELWKDVKTGELSFSLMYHSNQNEDFNDITYHIDGCPANGTCPISVYKKFADQVAPQLPWPELCQLPVADSATSLSVIAVFLMALLFVNA